MLTVGLALIVSNLAATVLNFVDRMFLLLVGRLGESAMAATTLAFSINSTAFLPLLGQR